MKIHILNVWYLFSEMGGLSKNGLEDSAANSVLFKLESQFSRARLGIADFGSLLHLFY